MQTDSLGRKYFQRDVKHIEINENGWPNIYIKILSWLRDFSSEWR